MVEFDPEEFPGTVVLAYGDANALRRGVAHAVLRDVLLHGPLDPGGSLESDADGWVEAFAALRGAWLADAFGVPAEAAAKHVATPLRAVLRSSGRALELVVDEVPCLDCELARQLVAHVARAAGAQLQHPPDHIAWSDVEAWRDGRLSELDAWVGEALRAAAQLPDGTVLDAWATLAERAAGTGLADLGACHLFAQRLAEDDAPARLEDGREPAELIPACATNTLDTLRLLPHD